MNATGRRPADPVAAGSTDHLTDETVAMEPMLVTLRREAEALSQGRHTITVEDERAVSTCGARPRNCTAPSPTWSAMPCATRRPAAGRPSALRRDSGRRRGAVGAATPATASRRSTCRASPSASTASPPAARASRGGTGLGLSIVKHVLGLHQARLEIESEVGRGSTFSCVSAPSAVHPRATTREPYCMSRHRHADHTRQPTRLRDPRCTSIANCRSWISISACWPRRRTRRCRCSSGCATCASPAPTSTNSSRSAPPPCATRMEFGAAAAARRHGAGDRAGNASTTAPANWSRRSTAAGTTTCARR